MGMMDDLGGKAKDVMNEPDKKQKVEQLAKDKGISIDQAKEHFTKHSDND